MRLLSSSLLVCLVISCSPYHTYYRYTFSASKADTIKTVIVAPLNVFIGMPDKLMKSSDTFYGEIISYLERNGYKIRDCADLESKWKLKIAESPGFFNPLNGTRDENKFYTSLTEFIREFCLLRQVDALIIPEIAVREAVLAGDRSYWDGVWRKLEIGKEYIASDRYNFSGKTYSLSLKVDIYDKNADQVFQSFGGIENHLRLSFNYNDKLETKEKLLLNDVFNAEAIKVAFHPFIVADIYPEKPKFTE